MKKFILNVIRNQKGFGVAAVVLLILAALGIGGAAYLFVNSLLDEAQAPLIEQGEQQVRNYFGLGCWWSSEYYGCQSQFLNSGNVFICQQTMTLTLLDCLAGRSDTGNKVYRVEVWTWDDVEEQHDELVGYSNTVNHNEIEYWPYGSGVLPQLSFVFGDTNPVVLLEDVEYVFRIVTYAGTTGSVWLSQRTLGHPCSLAVHLGAYSGGNYHDEYIYEYWMQGYITQTPTVTTIGSELRADGSVWLSGWCEVVANMNVGFLVSETEAVVTSGQGIKYTCGETGLTEAKHHFEQRVVSILTDVTYYYRAYAELNGMYYYGAVKNFNRIASGLLPNLYCDIEVSTMDLVEFNTSFIDVPTNTTWDIRIYYGTTLAIVDAETYNLTVAVDVTDDGDWFTEASPSLFTVGGKYYFRACADEDLGSRVCSSTHTFVAYDPGQPAVMNWLAGLFNLSFNWLWWAVAIAALLMVWLIAGFTKWWWLGIIGTGVLMIALITFGFVNPWVVVVLVIVCGWIIFKIVFKHSGGTQG